MAMCIKSTGELTFVYKSFQAAVASLWFSQPFGHLAVIRSEGQIKEPSALGGFGNLSRLSAGVTMFIIDSI